MKKKIIVLLLLLTATAVGQKVERNAGGFRFVTPLGTDTLKSFKVANDNGMSLFEIRKRDGTNIIMSIGAGNGNAGYKPSIETGNNSDQLILRSPAGAMLLYSTSLSLYSSAMSVAENGKDMSLVQSDQNANLTTQSTFKISAGTGNLYATANNAARKGSILYLSGGRGGIASIGPVKADGGNAVLRGGDAGQQDSSAAGSVFVVGGKAQVGANSTDGNVILAHSDTAARGKVGVGTNAPTELLDVAGNVKASGAMSAKTVVGDSSITGVQVIDTTRKVSAAGDSITFVLTEIRLPFSPAKGRKSGYVVYDFASELPYGYGGSGIMLHTIIADTANGVRIEAASYDTWGTRDGVPDYSFHAEQTLFWSSYVKTTKTSIGFAMDATWLMRTAGTSTQSRWNMRLNASYFYQTMMAGRVTIRYTIPQANNSLSPVRVVNGWI